MATAVSGRERGAQDPTEMPYTGSDTVDEQAQQEEVEDKLKECIDNVLDKSRILYTPRALPCFPSTVSVFSSAKTRQVALENLRLAFSSKMLFDFLLERRLTLTDSLEKCLKKGKGEEQSLAATVLTLLCLQMGSGPEGEEVFRSLKPLLINILTDTSASPISRQSCAVALGMCCYIAAADLEDLISCLTCLEGIFSTSCPEEGNSMPAQHSPLLQTLHCNALQSWSLLLTICPSSYIKKILDNHLLKLPLMLSSDNVNLRITAGETIALLFELARDMEEDNFYEDTDLLCTKLKALATDSNKYRAKTDRRRQRSIFRDVLHFIENNELLREIFDLGPPLVLDAAAIKASKISRFEKHLYNSAAFKARTKARSRVRDKRADIL
ncbi:interferon-related developmental regulator 2 isoform X4 [Alligator sinensis]|uniref:Interferon-related developmental regulator 2 isoform X4 n=1 Tax=Alligator sinensis TaxID=38654 RepID=A0A3Q0GL43_ALLSI|nr:interferon-related developmental regulator 2 isoform X4 [Alligator sinensis]